MIKIILISLALLAWTGFISWLLNKKIKNAKPKCETNLWKTSNLLHEEFAKTTDEEERLVLLQAINYINAIANRRESKSFNLSELLQQAGEDTFQRVLKSIK